MPILILILATLAFAAAVAGLTYLLFKQTKRDAHRWLADRRTHERRKVETDPPAETGERRNDERRTGEDPISGI